MRPLRRRERPRRSKLARLPHGGAGGRGWSRVLLPSVLAAEVRGVGGVKINSKHALGVAKGLVVVAAAAFGALFAVGCVIAAAFEVRGFGDSDGDPNRGYLLLLAFAFIACIASPVALWRWLLPRSSPSWGSAGAAVIVGVVIIMGLSLRP